MGSRSAPPIGVENRQTAFGGRIPLPTYQVFRNGRMVRAISPAISIRRIYCKASSS
jgi:hypothetical protein